MVIDFTVTQSGHKVTVHDSVFPISFLFHLFSMYAFNITSTLQVYTSSYQIEDWLYLCVWVQDRMKRSTF